MRPEDILNQWMQAINKADIESLLSLYDQDAILIPTFSNRVLNSQEKLRDYFEKLGSREDLSIALHENTVRIQTLNAGYYTVNGIYNWRFKVEGEILNFEARFSYLLDMNSQSPILHHHSSQVPRMV
ncbi:MAG: DUF4440 domain-containing protein [Spirochaetes bacterium]|nr:DUF4440 domain-containing protein [Spirochaetota bacterium]